MPKLIYSLTAITVSATLWMLVEMIQTPDPDHIGSFVICLVFALACVAMSITTRRFKKVVEERLF